MSNLEIILIIVSISLFILLCIFWGAYSEQIDEVEELKRINNCYELEKSFRRINEETIDKLHIRIRQLQCNADSKNVIIDSLKDRIDTSEKIIVGKNKIIEVFNTKINELQNEIKRLSGTKISKNDEKDVKPSLVKSFKKREPIIKAFRYSIDDPDYLKQKLEEIDAKCVLINFIDGSMIIKKYNDEELTVLEGQYIVNVDGNLQVMYSNDFRRFYEEE